MRSLGFIFSPFFCVPFCKLEGCYRDAVKHACCCSEGQLSAQKSFNETDVLLRQNKVQRRIISLLFCITGASSSSVLFIAESNISQELKSRYFPPDITSRRLLGDEPPPGVASCGGGAMTPKLRPPSNRVRSKPPHRGDLWPEAGHLRPHLRGGAAGVSEPHGNRTLLF